MELRRSPLRELHIELGAKLVEFGGWEMPVSYPSGTVAEHLACRNDAVWFDVSHLGTVRVEGSQALDSLQRTLINDLNKVEPGRAQYTQLLDNDGSVLDDIIVWWVSAQRFDVMPNASNTRNVATAIGGDDVTSSRAIFAVQGPNARTRVKPISERASEVAHNAVTEFEYVGVVCTAAGTGYTGEDGIECAVPVEVAEKFGRELLHADIAPAGLGARDTLRLEAGLPLHGHELGPGITPLQANLAWAVAWDKPEFTGREALIAERERGVSRKLFGLTTNARQPLRDHCEVFAVIPAQAGIQEPIGITTSGNYSPVLERGIALAFLPLDTEIGTKLTVDVRGRRVDVEVVKTPFVKRDKRP